MTTPRQPDDSADRDDDRPAYPPPPPIGPSDQVPARSGPPTLSIIGFVCAALALLVCPILFGPAGIVFGYLANNRGERYGKWAALASAIGLIAGLILSLILYNRQN
ncbi:hypothetical protein [Nocardia sp. NPDC050710]|uniref:hypothetical protein n=1 Tax=Nocardia sp. NPDC050710 TaxID=3157220 RepID=UPI0033C50326